MRKQVLRTVLATATAFSIAAMPALTVCAEDLDVNPEGSTIDVKYGDKLEENHGTVKNNYGTIVENAEDGTVEWTSSRSIIETNNGTVEILAGSLNTNTITGTIETVTTTATIENNNGKIINNSGAVKTNNGIIENNFDGATVGGNAPIHQWYSVDLDGSFDDDTISIEFEGSNWNEDRGFDYGYLEAGDGISGDYVIVAQDGYRITSGDGQQQFPDTCKCTTRQEGNKYYITISSITGYTILHLQDMLNLVIEEIQQQTGGGSSETGTVTVVVDDAVTVVSNDDNSGSSEPSAESYSTIPAGAITISLPRNAELTASAAAGPAVLGASREPARAASLKMAKLTDAQYKDAVIKNISDTPAGGLFRLETDRIGTFDRAMLEAFAKIGNVDMEVLFPLGSKKISVVIPAGYDINKLLDNKGYCGFLRLLALLGGEVVDK